MNNFNINNINNPIYTQINLYSEKKSTHFIEYNRHCVPQ